jgi:putative ABC transport system ATP-binding protein
MNESLPLELRDVSVTFADGDAQVTAMDHVDFTAPGGELSVITGPSGSGKSTLLAVAGLLSTPTSGSVQINGIDTVGLSAHRRTEVRRDHVAFVFQSANLFPSLRAVEQLEFVAHMRGELNDSSRARARELLEVVGLADRANNRPAKLSGGERQRVGIARALMTQPALLLVDEPTAALDQQRSNEIMELLAETTATTGVATVLVTHDLDRVDLANSRWHMVDGRLRRLDESATLPVGSPS